MATKLLCLAFKALPHRHSPSFPFSSLFPFREGQPELLPICHLISLPHCLSSCCPHGREDSCSKFHWPESVLFSPATSFRKSSWLSPEGNHLAIPSNPATFLYLSYSLSHSLPCIYPVVFIIFYCCFYFTYLEAPSDWRLYHCSLYSNFCSRHPRLLFPASILRELQSLPSNRQAAWLQSPWSSPWGTPGEHSSIHYSPIIRRGNHQVGTNICLILA